MAAFSVPDIVRLISDHSKEGPVIAVQERGAETSYIVYIDNKSQVFYESQLEKKPVSDPLRKVDQIRFHADLTASLLRNPTLTSLYSLNSGKIDFIPHQFKPVLKFIRSDRPRILIADGVGVGKTIEAGLILRELQARQDINSVLIICPRPLISEKKWEDEMSNRFGEDFLPLDGDALRYCIKETDYEGEWPDRYQKCIIPYSLFDKANVDGNDKKNNRLGLLQLDPPPHFDLIIVDEAHHIRNTNTFAYKAVKMFSENAEAVVFLTATPVQLEYDDLFVLLNLIRPDLFPDKDAFFQIAAPNEFINKASALVRSKKEGWQQEANESLLKACTETDWGIQVLSHNPDMKSVLERLERKSISRDERVQLITDIENLHTFSNIINRTRRRDIGEFTKRKPVTVEVPLSPAQKILHDEVLDITHQILSQIHCTENTKFMMTTIRRQTASCIFGLTPMLEDILYRHIDEYYEEGYLASVFDISAREQKPVRERIEDLIEMAKVLPDNDPKLQALLGILSDMQAEENNKVMIFSTFRHTLAYLYRSLVGHDLRVGMMHGGVNDEERKLLRFRFELPREDSRAIDVMLFSEIGCEGLDYQFCSCMVNYDLPWNPMRIEQRIGRIDRKGQTSDHVSIFNIITPDTVDYDIYVRCFERINVFEASVGDCEEILGSVARELQDIASNFKLSKQEKQERIDQMTDNKIRQMKEQAILEEQQYDFFGIHLPQSSIEQEVKAAANYWLSPEKLQNLVGLYLKERMSDNKDSILGEKALKTLRTSQELRAVLQDDFKTYKINRDSGNRRWEKWLRKGEQFLKITFDSECAKETPEAELITSSHPLVKQASLYFETDKKNVTEFQVSSDLVKPGSYPFIVYQWKMAGEREDLQIKPISADHTLNDHLLDLIKSAGMADSDHTYTQEIWTDAEKLHHEVWTKELSTHKTKTNALIDYKEGSITASYNARKANIIDRLAKASGKTSRMYEGMLRKASEDYNHRFQQMEEARIKADILTEVLAYGILTVVNEN